MIPTILSLAATVEMSHRTVNSYRASTLVQYSNPEARVAAGGGSISSQDLVGLSATEVTRAQSSDVRAEFRKLLGPEARRTTSLSVTASSTNPQLQLTATSPNPKEAAKAANAFAQAYATVRTKQLVQMLDSQRAQLEQFVTATQPTVDSLLAQISTDNSQIAQLQAAGAGGTQGTPQEKAQLSTLNTNVAQLAQQRDSLMQSQQQAETQEAQLQVEAALVPTTDVQVLEAAVKPGAPYNAPGRKYLLIGGLIGLIIGIGLAAARNHLDDRIFDPESVAEVAGEGALVLTVPTRRTTNKPGLEIVENPTAPYAEAYRSLRTAAGVTQGPDHRVLLVVAPDRSAQKSIIATNLGASLALGAKSVLVFEGDLRTADLAALLGLPRSPGWGSVLLGKASLDSAVTQVAPEEFGGVLDVLPVGDVPPSPADVMGSERFAELLDDLRQRYDTVVFDGAPVPQFSDVLSAAGSVTGALVVVAEAKTRKHAYQSTLEALRMAGVSIVATVFECRRRRFGTWWQDRQTARQKSGSASMAEWTAVMSSGPSKGGASVSAEVARLVQPFPGLAGVSKTVLDADGGIESFEGRYLGSQRAVSPIRGERLGGAD